MYLQLVLMLPNGQKWINAALKFYQFVKQFEMAHPRLFWTSNSWKLWLLRYCRSRPLLSHNTVVTVVGNNLEMSGSYFCLWFLG